MDTVANTRTPLFRHGVFLGELEVWLEPAGVASTKRQDLVYAWHHPLELVTSGRVDRTDTKRGQLMHEREPLKKGLRRCQHPTRRHFLQLPVRPLWARRDREQVSRPWPRYVERCDDSSHGTVIPRCLDGGPHPQLLQLAK